MNFKLSEKTNEAIEIGDVLVGDESLFMVCKLFGGDFPMALINLETGKSVDEYKNLNILDETKYDEISFKRLIKSKNLTVVEGEI